MMNKSDVVMTLTKAQKLTDTQAKQAVDLIFEKMGEALVKGDRIELRGFGSFAMRKYRSYTGRNPKTGEAVTVQGKSLPFFRPGKDIKKQVDGK